MFKNFIFICLLLSLTGCESFSSSSTKPPETSTNKKYVPDIPLEEKTALHPRGLDYNQSPDKIAFGSCANQDAPQPLWKTILGANPDVFLFLGDNIYSSRSEQKPAVEQYKKLNNIPEYREVREKIPFIVTWDDHDYGQNDGGGDYSEKIQAQRDFLNYWRYVKDSISLGQEGIYHSKLLGNKKQSILFIVLDTRYFRSPLVPANDPTKPLIKYQPNKDKSTTILGDQQWRWLEQQLRRKADIKIVMSSIQMLAESPGFEKWGNFPHEKQRFFNLLKKTKARNVFIVSGDRHLGVISKENIPGWGPLFEVTASSINRPTDIQESDPTYLHPVFNKENFGLFLIDWRKRQITLELKDINNSTVHSVTVPKR